MGAVGRAETISHPSAPSSLRTSHGVRAARRSTVTGWSHDLELGAVHALGRELDVDALGDRPEHGRRLVLGVGDHDRAALVGADIATCPPAVIKSLARHPLTDKGIEQFLADWKKTGQNI